MAVIYGWAHAVFIVATDWDDDGAEASYLLWENFWARKVDAYIFTDAGTTPRLTDADEILDVGDVINEIMILMNLYIKAQSTSAPLEVGLYDDIGFPSFKGDPNANNGKGSGHYAVLNKLRLIHSQSDVRVDSIRMGVDHDDNPFN